MAMPIKVAARLATGAPLDELYRYAEPRKSVRTTGLLRMLDRAAEKMRNYSVVVRACADENARLRTENARLREAIKHAPHDDDCALAVAYVEFTRRLLSDEEEPVEPKASLCDCWKIDALRSDSPDVHET